jgi:malate dehydrogenase (oxaloacetate-decarboxylating)(NADP+)
MKIAAVKALSELAREEVPAEVLAACELEALSFGPGYIIPKPMDNRLLGRLASAVARAAIDSGVARLPYPEKYPPFA